MSGGIANQTQKWPQLANGRGQSQGTPNFGNAGGGGQVGFPNNKWNGGGQVGFGNNFGNASGIGGTGFPIGVDPAQGVQHYQPPFQPVADPSQGVQHATGFTATGGTMNPPTNYPSEPLQSPMMNPQGGSNINPSPLQPPTMNPQGPFQGGMNGANQFMQNMNQRFGQANNPLNIPGMGMNSSKGAPGISGASGIGNIGNQRPFQNPDIGRFAPGIGQ